MPLLPEQIVGLPSRACEGSSRPRSLQDPGVNGRSQGSLRCRNRTWSVVMMANGGIRLAHTWADDPARWLASSRMRPGSARTTASFIGMAD